MAPAKSHAEAAGTMTEELRKKYERMEKLLRFERPDRIPVPGDYHQVEYNTEKYHLGEPELVKEGEVFVWKDGRTKTTIDGGNWRQGNPELYKDYNDVLNVPLERFAAETVDARMTGEMSAVVSSRDGSGFVTPLHYGTLITRATLEFDWEPFLLASALDAPKFGRVLDSFGEATLAVIKGWCSLDSVKLINIHDDIASTKSVILSPDYLREYVFPWYARFFSAVHALGKKVLYISDGNYFPVIDDIIKTGPDGLFIESSSMDPEDVMRAGGTKMIYRVKTSNQNIDVGTPEDIYAELKKLRELNEKYPSIMMYMGGGGKKPENVQCFKDYYQELLVYER
ncbi:MAG: uroporphyrinogen decarboxylase family protein [Spirochaetota bacterium]